MNSQLLWSQKVWRLTDHNIHTHTHTPDHHQQPTSKLQTSWLNHCLISLFSSIFCSFVWWLHKVITVKNNPCQTTSTSLTWYYKHCELPKYVFVCLWKLIVNLCLWMTEFSSYIQYMDVACSIQQFQTDKWALMMQRRTLTVSIWKLMLIHRGEKEQQEGVMR